jgi:nitronate monooxygenase
MYPCSNPELVAAVSEAGGIGVVQPLSLVYVHRHPFREGLRLIQSLMAKPIGMNVIVEKSSKVYQERMEKYLDEAVEEGVRLSRRSSTRARTTSCSPSASRGSRSP